MATVTQTEVITTKLLTIRAKLRHIYNREIPCRLSSSTASQNDMISSTRAKLSLDVTLLTRIAYQPFQCGQGITHRHLFTQNTLIAIKFSICIKIYANHSISIMILTAQSPLFVKGHNLAECQSRSESTQATYSRVR